MLKKCIFSLMFFLFIPTVYAFQANDLSQFLNSIRTMHANFSQLSIDRKGKALQRTSGQMALERPGKFRWDIKKPMPQLIIANGAKLWIYDSDLQQVTIRSLKRAAGEVPALLLSDNNPILDKEFVTKEKQVNGATTTFILTPKTRESSYSSIQLTFAQKQLREMQLVDKLGHSTKITFENIQMNMPLTSALFTFKATGKVDVIDETHQK